MPVVGGQHVLTALVEDGVQRVAGHVERHGIGAGVQSHLMEILEVVEIGENTAAGRVVLQVVQHPIHLIHLALRVLVLHPQLIAVGLADGAAFVGPAVPDIAPQVVDIVGFLLPDPQQLVDAGLEVCPPQGQDGKFLAEIVAVNDAEFFHRVGGRAVGPVGADALVGVPHTVSQNIMAVLFEYLVSVAHGGAPPVVRFVSL